MDINLLPQFKMFSDQSPRKIYLADLRRLSKIVRRKINGQRAAQAFNHFINLRWDHHLPITSIPSQAQGAQSSSFRPPFSKYPHKWSGGAALTETAIRNLMQDEGLKPRIRFIKGEISHPPQPSPAQTMWVVSGRMVLQFQNDGETVTLEPGDRLDLPAGSLYYLSTGAEGVVYLQARRKAA